MYTAQLIWFILETHMLSPRRCVWSEEGKFGSSKIIHFHGALILDALLISRSIFAHWFKKSPWISSRKLATTHSQKINDSGLKFHTVHPQVLGRMQKCWERSLGINYGGEFSRVGTNFLTLHTCCTIKFCSLIFNNATKVIYLIWFSLFWFVYFLIQRKHFQALWHFLTILTWRYPQVYFSTEPKSIQNCLKAPVSV